MSEDIKEMRIFMTNQQQQKPQERVVYVNEYDPNKPRYNQNHTRFCKSCGKTGHTIDYCWEKKEKEGIPRNWGFKDVKTPPKFSDQFPVRGRRGTPPSKWPEQSIHSPHSPSSPNKDKTDRWIGNNSPSGYGESSPHARTEPQRDFHRDPNKWGYHYEPHYRSTGNAFHDNYRYLNRYDSGYGPPLNQNRRGMPPKSPTPPTNTQRISESLSNPFRGRGGRGAGYRGRGTGRPTPYNNQRGGGRGGYGANFMHTINEDPEINMVVLDNQHLN